MHTWHNLFSKCTRNNHTDLVILHIFEELNTFFTISEGVDGVHCTPQLGEGVAAVIAVVFTIVVQPDEEDILDHLYGDSLTWRCTF